MKHKIKEVVQEKYSDSNFDVNKLAEILDVCRNYLNTKCQFEFDCTPHNLIQKYRIKKAMELLIKGERIISVCKKVGYTNRKTFYLAFKKITNTTPGKYLKCINPQNSEDKITQQIYTTK